MNKIFLDKKTGKVEPWTALQTAAYSILEYPEGLSFDEEAHVYRYNNRIYTSVTKILKSEGFIDTEWYNVKGRDRGTRVHDLTHLYDTCKLHPSKKIKTEDQPYLEAWVKFRKESGFMIDQSEVPGVNLTFGFSGKADTVGHFPETKNFDRCAVELHDDGTYKLYPYKDASDVRVFLSAVMTYNWKKLHSK